MGYCQEVTKSGLLCGRYVKTEGSCWQHGGLTSGKAARAEAVRGLVEAARGLTDDIPEATWKESPMKPGDWYWSPVARSIASSRIEAIRAALRRCEKEGL